MHQLAQRNPARAQPAAPRGIPRPPAGPCCPGATDDWKARYKIRAGVEGTISQAVQVCDLRTSRYRGLGKTSLQHQLADAAVNLIRINAWLTSTPRARTRTSPLTALRPAA
ncbi:transposase [Streptomyces europaeiscabiei]|uniref:transposase n=1 Tax=Streptomyces europaeiscabiei TaxID=146819 RepID=UPI0038D5151B